MPSSPAPQTQRENREQHFLVWTDSPSSAGLPVDGRADGLRGRELERGLQVHRPEAM